MERNRTLESKEFLWNWFGKKNYLMHLILATRIPKEEFKQQIPP